MNTLKPRKCLKHDNAALTVFQMSFSCPLLYKHIIANTTGASWSPGLRACPLSLSLALWPCLGCGAWRERGDPLCLSLWDEGVLPEYPVEQLVLS